MPEITVRNENGDIVRQDVLSRRVAVITDQFGFSEDVETPQFIEQINALREEGFTGLEPDPSEWTRDELEDFFNKLRYSEYDDLIDLRAIDFEVFDIDFAAQEGLFYPAVVNSVEYDHEGQMSSITSTCGETENRRSGDNLPDVTIDGIITESQLQDAKTLEQGQQITVISDVHSGNVLVKRVTITQSTDVMYYHTDGGDEELAFSFQLQLGQPDDES